MRDTRDSSCPASNCGRVRYPQQQKQQQQRGSAGQGNYGIVGSPMEPPPRYAYLDGLSESIPMVSGSPRYQVVRANYEKSVESAFIARTAVVSFFFNSHSLVYKNIEHVRHLARKL